MAPTSRSSLASSRSSLAAVTGAPLLQHTLQSQAIHPDQPTQPRCLRDLYTAVNATATVIAAHDDWQRRCAPLPLSIRQAAATALTAGHEWLLDMQLARASRKQADRAVARWLAYCHVMAISPILTTFSDTANLRSYIYFLGTVWKNNRRGALGLSPNYVGGLVSAIRQWHVDQGYRSPLDFDKVTSKVLRGLRRVTPSCYRPKLRMEKGMVVYICKRLRHGSRRHFPKKHALADCMELMFSFLLRISEAVQTPEKSSYLRQGDVRFAFGATNKVTIGLRDTKTEFDRLVERSLPNVSSTDVYSMMLDRWHINNAHALEHGYSDEQRDAMPFINVDGLPLSRMDVVRAVHDTLSDATTLKEHPEFPDANNYSTHSFRKGGATAMLAAGVDIATIKYLGRWRSMAWLIYASVTDASLARAAVALASLN